MLFCFHSKTKRQHISGNTSFHPFFTKVTFNTFHIRVPLPLMNERDISLLIREALKDIENINLKLSAVYLIWFLSNP